MASEILESMLFDDQKIVTAVTLCRHAAISVDESVDTMKTFFETNKGKDGLWAVYSISGYLNRNGVPTNATILCKDSDLKGKMVNFTNVRSTDIYSLQTTEFEDLYSIITSDMLEDKCFFREDAERASIKAAIMSELRLEMEKNQNEWAKSMNHIGTTKNSPSKSLNGNSCSSQKTMSNNVDCDATCTNSESNAKRRTKRILIDNEVPSPSKKCKEAEEDNQSGKTDNKNKENHTKTSINKYKEMSNEIMNKKKCAKKTLDDGDLFDATGSSPEKEMSICKSPLDVEQNSSNNTSVQTLSPRKRIGQIVKNIENSIPPAKRKVMKRVTETFKDEDGFLVTKDVLREISVEPVDESNVVLRPTSTINQVVASVQKGKKQAVPGSQSKISSFFSKK